MERDVTKGTILQMVDEMVDNPVYNDKGGIDAGWVSMNKLRVDTYVKMLSGDDGDIDINIEI